MIDGGVRKGAPSNLQRCDLFFPFPLHTPLLHPLQIRSTRLALQIGIKVPNAPGFARIIEAGFLVQACERGNVFGFHLKVAFEVGADAGGSFGFRDYGVTMGDAPCWLESGLA